VRLGIISDTHGKLRPQVFDVFAEVQHILHAGDVGEGDIIGELEALAPVTAVYGNVDGDQFGSPTPARLHAAFPDAEIIIYGHTHRPLVELVDRTVTVMNPGSAGAARFQLKPSVGIMELEPGIPPRARLISLGDG